jgi:mitotic spindle assembly checkpoint protein MAD1
MKKKVEEQDKQLAEQEHRMGRGDVNWDNFKVLHLAINPETQARAKSNNELESIQAENKILTTRLDELQRKLNSVNSTEDVAELKKKADESELRIARLKEVFQKKISDFRRVVYLLFGFRIDLENNSRYRLSSMYAETQDDYLFFSFNEQMEFVLHETDFTASLDPRVMGFLTKFRSIPAFVSTITLDLFHKQTIFATM